MKKRTIIIMICIFLIILYICFEISISGKVSNVNINEIESNIYEDEEIEKAMEVVKDRFRKTNHGCTLTDLWYDEDYNIKIKEDYEKKYNTKEVIVLKSNFDTGPSTIFSSPGMNSNFTYKNFNWILVKIDNKWTLVDSGY